MARYIGKYCKETEKVIWYEAGKEPPEENSNRPNFGVIEDTMDETWHPSNGQHYTSKSEFRKVTKAFGGEEVGNEYQKQMDRGEFDSAPRQPKAADKEKVMRAYYDAVERTRRNR